MGMLDRYKKKGGFAQLLTLIETCGPQKQEKFLEMVKAENQGYFAAIKQKMLTMERVLTWSDDVVMEIVGQVNELTLATALVGLGEPVKQRVFKYFSASQQRRITDVMQSKTGNTAEITTAYLKILEEVRNMINNRTLRAEKFDPAAIIEEDIEDKIAQGKYLSAAETFAAAASVHDNVKHVDFGGPETAPAPASADGMSLEGYKNEVAQLQRKLATVVAENMQLKKALRAVEEKLEKIRQIA